MPTDTLAAALADLQRNLPHIGKDAEADIPTKTGGRYKYNYADLATITDALMPLLGARGLAFTACPTLNSGGQFVLAYRLGHVDGGDICGFYPLGTGTPQQLGSAITYARRYCLCAITGVAPGGEDDDGGAAESAARADGLPTNRDGSLSRSRTSDEEKAAAGVMTSAQLAEHNALRREGTPPAEAVAKLPTTPVDDPFYADARPKPAGWLLSEEFARLGVFDRAERLAQTSELIGRPITSSNELEPVEVQAVLNVLRKKEVPA